ncbi:MAG: polymer-forming cytoskeletal protein [Acidobacteria bacterium]|nr:polymer-forming cytoskeletal protein [Acidobacteriota bacterium]
MARNSDALNGFLDPGCTVRGDLEFESSFRLDGKVEGVIRSAAELLIGESGVVEGEIEVARCVIGGTVRGTIRASASVQLLATAKVWADVHAPALVMEEGAFLEGQVAMEKSSPKATSASRNKPALKAAKP